jgi:hypothetical protein
MWWRRREALANFMRLLSQAAFFSLFWPAFCIGALSPGLQRVLVLYSDERLLPANVIFDNSFRTNLQAATSRRVEFHSEFLDASRFWREAQQENQRDFLRGCLKSPDSVIFHRLCFPIQASKQLGRTLLRVP